MYLKSLKSEIFLTKSDTISAPCVWKDVHFDCWKCFPQNVILNPCNQKFFWPCWAQFLHLLSEKTFTLTVENVFHKMYFKSLQSEIFSDHVQARFLHLVSGKTFTLCIGNVNKMFSTKCILNPWDQNFSWPRPARLLHRVSGKTFTLCVWNVNKLAPHEPKAIHSLSNEPMWATHTPTCSRRQSVNVCHWAKSASSELAKFLNLSAWKCH